MLRHSSLISQERNHFSDLQCWQVNTGALPLHLVLELDRRVSSEVAHCPLVVQLFLPGDPVLNPVSTACSPAEVFLAWACSCSRSTSLISQIILQLGAGYRTGRLWPGSKGTTLLAAFASFIKQKPQGIRQCSVHGKD